MSADAHRTIEQFTEGADFGGGSVEVLADQDGGEEEVDEGADDFGNEGGLGFAPAGEAVREIDADEGGFEINGVEDGVGGGPAVAAVAPVFDRGDGGGRTGEATGGGGVAGDADGEGGNVFNAHGTPYCTVDN